MKKFIATIAAVSLLAVPAVAEAHGRNDGHRHRHGVSTGGAVAIGLGALILGGALANSNRQRYEQRYDPRYEPRYEPQYQQQYVCQNEYVRDYDGNYILDRYGRAIYTQRCWYQ